MHRYQKAAFKWKGKTTLFKKSSNNKNELLKIVKILKSIFKINKYLINVYLKSLLYTYVSYLLCPSHDS